MLYLTTKTNAFLTVQLFRRAKQSQCDATVILMHANNGVSVGPSRPPAQRSIRRCQSLRNNYDFIAALWLRRTRGYNNMSAGARARSFTRPSGGDCRQETTVHRWW